MKWIVLIFIGTVFAQEQPRAVVKMRADCTKAIEMLENSNKLADAVLVLTEELKMTKMQGDNVASEMITLKTLVKYSNGLAERAKLVCPTTPTRTDPLPKVEKSKP